jgi:hypothetical protein
MESMTRFHATAAAKSSSGRVVLDHVSSGRHRRGATCLVRRPATAVWSRKNRAPTRPTRPSPAAISASISPAASRTCPSAPDCATGCGTTRAATAAGVRAAEQSRTPSGRLDVPSTSPGRSLAEQRTAGRPAGSSGIGERAKLPDLILSYLSLCKRREKSYKKSLLGFTTLHDSRRYARRNLGQMVVSLSRASSPPGSLF